MTGTLAWYQRRGLIHFHAVWRIDGPEGPDQSPPSWATADLLDHCLRSAVTDITVPVPHPDGQDIPLALQWGSQLDIQPIHVAAELDGIADKHVARYIAKYATKGAEPGSTDPLRVMALLHQGEGRPRHAPKWKGSPLRHLENRNKPGIRRLAAWLLSEQVGQAR